MNTVFNSEESLSFIRHSLKEDIGTGDHSSNSCISHDQYGEARLLVKDDGILAGVELAKVIFNEFDPTLSIEVLIEDGNPVKHGDIGFYVKGSARSILSTERLVLNCMQRLSGVATSTNKIVQKLSRYKTKVLDTRKTTPGMRFLEKWAVKVGGGENHRIGLYDMIMLKDNHIDYAGGIEQAINKANDYLRLNKLDLKIEVETRNLAEVKEVLEVGGIHRIMLDNFTPPEIKEAVELIQGNYETEASGGITIDNIEAYAAAGVDFISVGALTHSVKSLDLSLKVKK